MKLSRIVQRGKASPIHSSGFVQRPDQMGSVSVDPFSQRLQRDRSRRLVGGYRDARVLLQGRHDNRDSLSTSRRDARDTLNVVDGSQSTNQRYGSRIDIVKPTGGAALSPSPTRAAPQQHVFREPPSRHRP